MSNASLYMCLKPIAVLKMCIVKHKIYINGVHVCVHSLLAFSLELHELSPAVWNLYFGVGKFLFGINSKILKSF